MPTVEGHGTQCVAGQAHTLRSADSRSIAFTRARRGHGPHDSAINPIAPHAPFRHMSGRGIVAVQAVPQRIIEESTMSTHPQPAVSSRKFLSRKSMFRPRASRIAVAFAVALAASLIAMTAQAADSSAVQQTAKTSRPNTTTGSRIPDRSLSDLDEVMVIGAVEDPTDAREPEDTSVPALPERRTARRGEAATGSRIADQRRNDLDTVMVIGAVEDPADADAPEDISLPELPVLDTAPTARADF